MGLTKNAWIRFISIYIQVALKVPKLEYVLLL